MTYLPCKISEGGGSGGTLIKATIATELNSMVTRTIDVSAILPNVYQSLTIDNFGLDASATQTSGSASAKLNTYALANGSYNSSTGILTISDSHSSGTSRPYNMLYNVYCWYIG